MGTKKLTGERVLILKTQSVSPANGCPGESCGIAEVKNSRPPSSMVPAISESKIRGESKRGSGSDDGKGSSVEAMVMLTLPQPTCRRFRCGYQAQNDLREAQKTQQPKLGEYLLSRLLGRRNTSPDVRNPTTLTARPYHTLGSEAWLTQYSETATAPIPLLLLHFANRTCFTSTNFIFHSETGT